jgi:hypothetical protein
MLLSRSAGVAHRDVGYLSLYQYLKKIITTKPPCFQGGFFYGYGGEKVHGSKQFRKKRRIAFFDANAFIALRRSSPQGCGLSIPLTVFKENYYY